MMQTVETSKGRETMHRHNVAKKELRSPKFRARVVRPKKGRGAKTDRRKIQLEE